MELLRVGDQDRINELAMLFRTEKKNFKLICVPATFEVAYCYIPTGEYIILEPNTPLMETIMNILGNVVESGARVKELVALHETSPKDFSKGVDFDVFEPYMRYLPTNERIYIDPWIRTSQGKEVFVSFSENG